MPAIEVDINEKGEIGKLPEPLQKFLDARIQEAFGKGAEKTAREAKEQMDAAIKQARDEERSRAEDLLRKAGTDPAATEKAKNLEIELSKMREAEAERAKNYEAAKAEIEKRHANDLSEREKRIADAQAEIQRRTSRIRELATKEIRLEAVKAGARNESLDELNLLLSGRIGLTDDLQVFVVDGSDPSKPALDADGNPVSIEGLVQQYLTDHPHHKLPPPGKGGGAAGGRSLTGHKQTAEEAAREAVFDDVAKNPTVGSVAKAFAVIGKRAS